MAYSNYYTDVFEHNGEFIFIRDFPIRGEKRLGLILCRMDIASLYRWFKRSQGAYANQIYVFNREGGPLWGSLAEYDADILEAYQTCSTQGETSITRNGPRTDSAGQLDGGYPAPAGNLPDYIPDGPNHVHLFAQYHYRAAPKNGGYLLRPPYAASCRGRERAGSIARGHFRDHQ
jgi:hypothetical protein